MRCAQKLVQTMRARAKRTMVMETGTKDPALFLGSIVLQSFVVHLDRVGFWSGKESKRSYSPLVISSGLPCGRELLRPGQRNAEAVSRAAATVPGGDHWSAAIIACVHQLLCETPKCLPAA